MIEARKKLKSAAIPSFQSEAELLLGHALQKERIWLYKNPNYLPSRKEMKTYWACIKRRSLGEPYAYIVSSQEFFGHRFSVNPKVLIPRPESEELVELALGLSLTSKQIQVLDLCCGSGCIGLSFFLEKKNICLGLSDRSPGALKVCRQNARNLAPSLSFSYLRKKSAYYRIYCSDLFAKLPSQGWDLILSNPPYALLDEYAELPFTVRGYEPKEALLCSQPAIFYKRLITEAAGHLKSRGYILLESNPRFISFCKDFGAQLSLDTEIRKDLSGKRRFLLLRSRV